MALTERQRFLRDYRVAVQAYSEAVENFDETSFADALKRTEAARERAENARAALLGAANSSASGGSTLLFNIDTERWVVFEMAECGSPPAGALAYVPSPGHQRGEWIVTAQEMSNRERQSVKLYFTEAGLSILRKAGLEM